MVTKLNNYSKGFMHGVSIITLIFILGRILKNITDYYNSSGFRVEVIILGLILTLTIIIFCIRIFNKLILAIKK